MRWSWVCQRCFPHGVTAVRWWVGPGLRTLGQCLNCCERYPLDEWAGPYSEEEIPVVEVLNS